MRWQSVLLPLLPVVVKHKIIAVSCQFDGVDFSEIKIKPLTPELRQLDRVFRYIIGNRDEFNGKRILTFGLTMFLLATLRFWLMADAIS